eukprot:PhM_4_TR15183/c7_g1_i1/m.41425
MQGQGYPAQQGYPSHHGGGYPQQYPPQQQGYPPQGGYPAAQPYSGYPPPQQQHPQQGGYPQQGYYNPAQGQQQQQQQFYPPQQQGHPQHPQQARPGQHVHALRPGVQAGAFTYRPPESKSDMKDWNAQGKWVVEHLCCAGFKDPLFCCTACFCPWCMAYSQRKKLLMGNMQYYECCAGINGRMCTSRMNKCTKGNEECCLCIEVCCCLGCSVHGNRWMVQQHYGLENTCCDVFIMYLACFCSILACLTGEESLETISDIIYYSMISCMLTQHEIQMKQCGYPNGVRAMT